MKEQNYISIAKVLGFHGVNGEVRAGYTHGHEQKLSKLKSVFINNNGAFEEIKVSSVRFHKKYVLFKFKDYNSISDAEYLKNTFLYITKACFDSTLDNDEFLISDLIGMYVYNLNDELVGIVNDVTSNGATDILVIKSDIQPDKNYLVPFVKALVPEVDKGSKKILVNDIEGLLE